MPTFSRQRAQCLAQFARAANQPLDLGMHFFPDRVGLGQQRPPGRRQSKTPAAAVLLVLFTYFGTPLYAVSAPPAVEIGQKYMPEECVLPPVPLIPEDCGEVRRLGYDAIPVGTFDLSQFATAPANANQFQRMLAQMQTDVAEQARRASAGEREALAEAKGFFVVEDWQTALKKVTLRVTWTPRAQGDTGTYEKIIYLHKDSDYQ